MPIRPQGFTCEENGRWGDKICEPISNAGGSAGGGGTVEGELLVMAGWHGNAGSAGTGGGVEGGRAGDGGQAEAPVLAAQPAWAEKPEMVGLGNTGGGAVGEAGNTGNGGAGGDTGGASGGGGMAGSAGGICGTGIGGADGNPLETLIQLLEVIFTLLKQNGAICPLKSTGKYAGKASRDFPPRQ